MQPPHGDVCATCRALGNTPWKHLDTRTYVVKQNYVICMFELLDRISLRASQTNQ